MYVCECVCFFRELADLIQRTLVSGESNSVLIIGHRGTGKSMVRLYVCLIIGHHGTGKSTVRLYVCLITGHGGTGKRAILSSSLAIVVLLLATSKFVVRLYTCVLSLALMVLVSLW